MKRVLILVALIAAIFAGSGTAIAAPDDTKGPSCADLGTAFGFYGTDAAGDAVFTIELTTHAPSCRNVSYVLHESNGRFADRVQSGDGAAVLTYTVNLGRSPNATPAGTAPTEICVYFTSELGNHIADRSPDTQIKDCVVYPLDPGGGPGGEGFDQ